MRAHIQLWLLPAASNADIGSIEPSHASRLLEAWRLKIPSPYAIGCRGGGCSSSGSHSGWVVGRDEFLDPCYLRKGHISIGFISLDLARSNIVVVDDVSVVTTNEARAEDMRVNRIRLRVLASIVRYTALASP